MADAPDQTQALLALQQHASQVAAGNKQGALFGLLPDVQISPFRAEGWGGKMIVQKKGGKPSLAEKIFGSITEDFKKMAEGAGVMYSGDLPTGTPVAPGGGGDSSFTANISAPSIGSDSSDIGR